MVDFLHNLLYAWWFMETIKNKNVTIYIRSYLYYYTYPSTISYEQKPDCFKDIPFSCSFTGRKRSNLLFPISQTKPRFLDHLHISAQFNYTILCTISSVEIILNLFSHLWNFYNFVEPANQSPPPFFFDHTHTFLAHFLSSYSHFLSILLLLKKA